MDEIKDISRKKICTFNNLADKLSWLPGLTAHAQAILIADGAPLLVYTDQRHGVDEGQQDGGEPDTAGLALNVEHVGVTLGGPVKLTNTLHSKSERVQSIFKIKVINKIGYQENFCLFGIKRKWLPFPYQIYKTLEFIF